MIESLREIIAKNLPFLPEEERLRALRVKEMYVSIIGQVANEYVLSILLDGAKIGKVKNFGHSDVISMLVNKMEELYVKHVAPARIDRAKRAALVLSVLQDDLNRQLIPDYKSPFDDRNPISYGPREILN